MTAPVITMELDGVRAMIRSMHRSEKAIGAAAQKGMKKGANHLRDESLKIVPIESKELRDSCEKPKNVGGRGLKADYIVQYEAEYAVWVHEIPNPPHAHGRDFNIKHAADIAAGKYKAKRPDEQWKFLEKPMRTERDAILKIIGDEIRGTK
jgi:hypothetical protein